MHLSLSRKPENVLALLAQFTLDVNWYRLFSLYDEIAAQEIQVEAPYPLFALSKLSEAPRGLGNKES